MVHGILQFTPSIAFRYVLHRCESLDIRCRESFWIVKEGAAARARTVSGAAGASSLVRISLAQSAPGFVVVPRGERNDARGREANRTTRDVAGGELTHPRTAGIFFTCSRVVLLGRFRQ
jgi:hypothetical protein